MEWTNPTPSALNLMILDIRHLGKALADVPQAPCGLTGSPGSTQLAAISSKGPGKTSLIGCHFDGVNWKLGGTLF